MFDPLGGHVTRRNGQADAGGALGDLAIVENEVFIVQHAQNLVWRQAQFRQARGWNRDRDHLFGEALNLDLGDTVHGH